MQCPNCKSNNVFVQQVTEGSESKTKTKVYSLRHGILWWLFIGWWWWIVVFCWDVFLFLCTGGIYIFFRKKRKVGKESGTTTTKNINRTVATCQNCGKTWNV